MVNHLHLIWQMQSRIKRSSLQSDFLKYTAQRIKKDLSKNHPTVLPHFLVKTKDREHQFWERNPLSVEIWSEKVLVQKLRYIHENPVRAGLCQFPDEYKYSSACFIKLESIIGVFLHIIATNYFQLLVWGSIFC